MSLRIIRYQAARDLDPLRDQRCKSAADTGTMSRLIPGGIAEAEKTMPGRGPGISIPLVSRFRSSHQYAAPSFANFGIEGH
jgi:hypothetical protein